MLQSYSVQNGLYSCLCNAPGWGSSNDKLACVPPPPTCKNNECNDMNAKGSAGRGGIVVNGCEDTGLYASCPNAQVFATTKPPYSTYALKQPIATHTHIRTNAGTQTH